MVKTDAELRLEEALSENADDRDVNVQLLYPGFSNLWLFVPIAVVLYVYFYQNAQAAILGSPIEIIDLSPHAIISSFFIVCLWMTILYFGLPAIARCAEYVVFNKRIIFLLRKYFLLADLHKGLLEAKNTYEDFLKSSRVKEHRALMESYKSRLALVGSAPGAFDLKIDLQMLESELSNTERVEKTMHEALGKAERMWEWAASYVILSHSVLLLLVLFIPSSALFITMQSECIYLFIILGIIFGCLSKVGDFKKYAFLSPAELLKGNVYLFFLVLGLLIYLAPHAGRLSVTTLPEVDLETGGVKYNCRMVGRVCFDLEKKVMLDGDNKYALQKGHPQYLE